MAPEDVQVDAPEVPVETQPRDFQLPNGYVARAAVGSIDIFHPRGGVRIPYEVWCALVSNMQVFYEALNNAPPVAAPPLPREPKEGDVVEFHAVYDHDAPAAGPEAARVTVVHSPSTVDLALVDRDGAPVVVSVAREDLANPVRPFWRFPAE